MRPFACPPGRRNGSPLARASPNGSGMTRPGCGCSLTYRIVESLAYSVVAGGENIQYDRSMLQRSIAAVTRMTAAPTATGIRLDEIAQITPTAIATNANDRSEPS